MLIIRKIKSLCFAHFSSPLKTYKVKEFDKLLNSKGYYYHHTKGSHKIYVSNDSHYVVVPYKGKEVNSMMSTVILQRIEHNLTRKL